MPVKGASSDAEPTGSLIHEPLELAAEDDAVLQAYFEALTRRLQAALGVRAVHADSAGPSTKPE